MRHWIAVVLLALAGAAAAKEPPRVFVKYVGWVSLEGYHCVDIAGRSSFIADLCHNPARQTVLAGMNGTLYAYCPITAEEFVAWVQAPSLGKHFNRYIKGQRDCWPK